MGKISLAAQISIIFIVSFLLTSALLGVFIPRRMENLYENTIYEKLEAEGKTIRLSKQRKDYETEENIAFISYIKADNTYYTSSNLMPFIDKEAINLLIGKAFDQTPYQARYKNTVDGEDIYYVILNYPGVLDEVNDDILIIITDSSMRTELAKSTIHQIYILGLIAFVLGYVIILVWITRFINDTRRISLTLDRIGENHYRTKITTKRRDEMGELVANIENMRLKIIENERMRQEIIQGVSHDLKTPIALISSYVEAYEDGMCEAEEMAQIAKKETRRLNAKVTKLLNLTRLGYIDKNPKTIKRIEMKKLIDELVSLYNFQEKIKIEKNLCQCEFMGDRESWLIAAQNILDNAMRYAKSKITINLTPQELTIANDGKPIDESILPNIFEAFEKGTDGNFGIGLSIVKRTVEMFGYHIKAENAADGVSFVIYK